MTEIRYFTALLNEELRYHTVLMKSNTLSKDTTLKQKLLSITVQQTEIIAVIERAAKNLALDLFLNSTGYGRHIFNRVCKPSGYHIFMADSDGTYDFKDIPLFIRKLKEGADLVVGNRFTNKMEKVMPWHHNP